MFFTNKLKEGKDELQWTSVFSLVSEHISFLLSIIGPMCCWLFLLLDHTSRSLSRVLASGSHSPLLHPSSFLDFPDLWVLTCFLYPLSPPKRLTPTWVFSGLNYNRKNVICSWQKKEETIFQYLSDYRQERVCLRVRDQLRIIIRAQRLTPLLSTTLSYNLGSCEIYLRVLK